MEQKLTKEICEEFNEILKEENSVIRLKHIFDGIAEFKFPQDDYIHPRCTIWTTQAFVDKVERFLTDKGIINIRFPDDYSAVHGGKIEW